jgi:AraC-like DNA-binding protein
VQKLFAAHGATFSDFLREKRLAAAAALLHQRSHHTSIEEVAYDCGFSDLSTFYRNFKARYGLNPGGVRQEPLPAPGTPTTE